MIPILPSLSATILGQQAPKADPTKTHEMALFKHNRALFACRFDPAGRFIFASSQDNTIQRWELATGKQVAFKGGHDSWTRGIAFDPKGETMYTAAYDGRLIWWPAASDAPTPQRIVEAHVGWARSVSVSPDGKLLATAGNDHMVRLWNAADGAKVRDLPGHTCHVYNTAFHPNGQFLVSGDLKGNLKQWEVATGKEMRQFDASPLWKYDGGFAADIGGVRGMDFSPDGKLLTAAGITNVSNAFAGVGNPMVVLIDFEQGKVLQKFVSKEAIQGVAWSSVCHPDGFVIGATGGGAGGKLFFWKPADPNQFHSLNLPASLQDMDLHPDGIRLAVAHYDGNMRIYKMGEKKA